MLMLVNTINDMIDQLAIFAAVAREVGTEGNLEVQATDVGNLQYLGGNYVSFVPFRSLMSLCDLSSLVLLSQIRKSINRSTTSYYLYRRPQLISYG